jgi:hypothetical protein
LSLAGNVAGELLGFELENCIHARISAKKED